MQRLTSEDIIKLAAVSDKARDYFINMAKLAAGHSSSEFDETTPAANTEQLDADKANMKEQEQQQQPTDQATAVPATEEAPMAVAAPEGPEAIGARAAQAFLGPEIMQAAMSGDPMAQDLVSRTAGQVAGSVTESAMRGAAAPAGGEMVPGQEGMDPGMAAQPAVTSPEEDLANEIIPPVQAPAAAPVGPNGAPVAPPAQSGTDAEQGQMDAGKGGETQAVPNGNAQPAAATAPGAPAAQGSPQADVTEDDIKKIIALAKSGQI